MTLVVPGRSHAPPSTSDDGLRPHRFSLADYLRMSEVGLFDGKRVEFIDGEVLHVTAREDPHTYGVTRATRWCFATFPETGYWVRIHSTLLTAGSAPDPDLAVMGYPEAGTGEYASADRAVLVIEVADSTLLADTTSKMSLYASAGVRDYWVLSIPDRVLIVHRQPVRSAASRHGWAYAEVRRFAGGEPVSPLAMPAASVEPARLLP